ncbi:Septum site-determining protein MinD [Poriferisphaera corsica]|uniref:Iron-sulfur cluster carrier protein n=1 Tax=Poriferisphaera corsica TaxID=2528020 RepID=A0A517YUP8_9BACT|nr:Mrp/NBP35 family ATP-binding protein [Poriferisphaera corsica]QDU33944.1 Septum site-determining protein MinD [Poriferisphaera corsica]
MAIDKAAILERLKTVMDPELHRDIVTLNMVTNVAYCDGLADITVTLPKSAAGIKEMLEGRIREALRELNLAKVEVSFAYRLTAAEQEAATANGGGQEQAEEQAEQSPQDVARASNPLPSVKHVIAVGAGKGGVGKSTVSVNLAVALARSGAKVGIMDGDIYGPSLPTMLGTDKLELKTIGNMIVPFEMHGVKVTTIGALVEDDKPLIWRGPMAHGAFKQLATQTDWGDLDYLIIDLPPGTGDVPLTLSQLLPLAGAVVVCTPQKVAQDDAVRALKMFEQLDINILGVVENMSYFIGNDGVEYDIFGRGGAEMMAQENGVPFLGSIPINMGLRKNSDAGDPTANFEDSKLGEELMNVAKRLTHQVSLSGPEDWTPSISIS